MTEWYSNFLAVHDLNKPMAVHPDAFVYRNPFASTTFAVGRIHKRFDLRELGVVGFQVLLPDACRSPLPPIWGEYAAHTHHPHR